MAKLIDLDRIKTPWKITLVFSNDFKLVFNGIILRYADLDKWVCGWVADHVNSKDRKFTYLAEKYD